MKVGMLPMGGDELKFEVWNVNPLSNWPLHPFMRLNTKLNSAGCPSLSVRGFRGHAMMATRAVGPIKTTRKNI